MTPVVGMSGDDRLPNRSHRGSLVPRQAGHPPSWVKGLLAGQPRSIGREGRMAGHS